MLLILAYFNYTHWLNYFLLNQKRGKMVKQKQNYAWFTKGFTKISL